MTLSAWLFLFVSMVVLAVLPGPGMLAVIARSMSSGFSHGVVTTIGIVAGDFVFIVLVFFGMAAMASLLGELFRVVSYLGGVYLIYLGISLIRSKTQITTIEEVKEPSWVSNFTTGLFITLSNPKAILFYAGFFPAFLDVNSASLSDLVLILVAVTIAVGGSMLVYAYLASRAKERLSDSRTQKKINYTAGGLLALTGGYLLAKA